MKRPLPILALCLIFFISCSVQKRKYQNGFYVDWHAKKSQRERANELAAKPHDKQAAPAAQSIVTTPGTEAINASADIHAAPPELKKQPVFARLAEDTCDVLVYKDGSEIRVKVQEVGITEIKYKRCDALEGPMYISRKSELFMIKYANGTREVIKSELPETTPRQQQSLNQYKQNKYKRENHPLALPSLLLGALSIVLAYAVIIFLTMGFGPAVLALPIIAGLAAVITGRTALRRIKEQPEMYKGKGLAIPGFIMGTVILGIFAFIGFIAFLFLI